MFKVSTQTIVVFSCIFLLTSCLGVQNNTEFDSIIDEWKNNLIENKIVGPPCSEDIPKWIGENPDLFYGIQEMQSKITDYNNDGIKDGLFYFKGMNCLGIPKLDSDFALLVYSKNDQQIIDSLITKTIENTMNTSLQNTYNTKIVDSKVFYESFKESIIGRFEAWNVSDPSCCPTYTGSFEYTISAQNINFKDVIVQNQ